MRELVIEPRTARYSEHSSFEMHPLTAGHCSCYGHIGRNPAHCLCYLIHKEDSDIPWRVDPQRRNPKLEKYHLSEHMAELRRKVHKEHTHHPCQLQVQSEHMDLKPIHTVTEIEYQYLR